MPPSKSGSDSTETRFGIGVDGAEDVGDGHIETSNRPEPFREFRSKQGIRKKTRRKKRKKKVLVKRNQDLLRQEIGLQDGVAEKNADVNAPDDVSVAWKASDLEETTVQDDAKFVDDDDSDGGGGVSRELEPGPEEVEVDEVEEGMKRLSKEAARALALPVPLETVLLLAERDVVLDQVLEQLSTTIVVIFLPVAVVDVVADVADGTICRSWLLPDFSETSLAGPVADASEIFSSSNSTGPVPEKEAEKAVLSFPLLFKRAIAPTMNIEH